MSFIAFLKLESDCDGVGEAESGMGMGDLACLNIKKLAEGESVGLSFFFRDISAKVFT